ncbi:uncharacterized protein LOC113238427 isoform X2 [Hyposmocoma kahamanoa]|uniref:uncharacterized protein LOC113238427 isoform X2 n=1 Tax=Hyposmocoma kahamanoa TaxID=1477025 RepID=UPI000E6D6C3F|nr:uncharacterized protein LOC113238427 isoform X2 [Hyposmocoma kahamanoa]
MNIARTVCAIKHTSFGKNVVRKFRISSANYESSQATQPQVKEETFNFEDLKTVERTERRKEKIQPFMKDVFVSVFNRDLLAFPEILNKDESEALDQRVNILEKVFTDPEKSKSDRKEALKRIGLYGAPVKLTNGGLAMNMTESIRYLETVGLDLELGQQISDHWVALEALKVGFSEENFQKIVDDLISGENPIGLCIKEKLAERISQADFRTTAELDSRGIWRISGEKICFNQGGYYLVLSAVEADRLKAFLVHPNAEGITCDESCVTFLKTPGTPLDQCTEQQIAQTLGLSRLQTATLCRRALHSVLNNMRELVLRGETLPTTVSMFIALNGIHHAGKLMADEVKQIRNPLFHPTFIFRKVIANRHQERDDPKLDLYLAEHLHPSLKSHAEQLEYCVLRMKFASETLLSRHGVDIGTACT